MDLIGKPPELSEYPGNVKHFLFDLKMFFHSNALGDSRRRSLFWNVVGKVGRDKIRNECNLGKDPLDQLYDCLERVYSTHSGSEHTASSEDKREAAFCPESGTAAGDTGFLAGDTPTLGATARSSRGKEDEGALREKAQSSSDLKISKNSQRTPAVASRERSVSPTSAAPSPGAEPMVDDTPVIFADSPPDEGTLGSRPESPASARKLRCQQEETPITPVVVSDEEHSSSSQTNAKAGVKVTPKTRLRRPAQKVAEEQVTGPCMFCERLKESGKDTPRLTCKKCGEKIWAHLTCFPVKLADPNLYECEECKKPSKRRSITVIKQQDSDHDDDEDEDESATETDDDDISFSQSKEFKLDEHLLDENDLSRPVDSGTEKTGGSTQLTSTPAMCVTHSARNRSKTDQTNEDESRSGMESYAACESSSSTTTQPKGTHSPGSSGSSGAPPAKRKNIRPVVSNIEDGITTTARVLRRHGGDSHNLQVIANIVNSVLAHGEAEPFAQPVSLKDVPDYLEVVKEPMDFGTIRIRLRNMHYHDVETVLKDVHLVFQNCDDYNDESKDTYKSGLELERHFLKLLKTQLKDFFPRYTMALV